jgi:hypothetical protein
MANQKVRHLLGKLNADPQLAKRLAEQRDPKARHDLLTSAGVISAGDTPPTQEEIRKEVLVLLGSGGQQPQQGERMVEWVAAVATAAALL